MNDTIYLPPNIKINYKVHFSENEFKNPDKGSKRKSADVTKEIDGKTYHLDFSDCLKNLDTNRKTRKANQDKPMVAISSEESDASGPITRLKPLNKRKTRAIRSSSDESDVNMISSTDSIPEIKLKGINRTNRNIITIPDIPIVNKLKHDEIQIEDSCDSMETEFDSRDVIVDGKPTKKHNSPVITGKPKRNTASRRITDKSMYQDYVEPILPRFKKKKPPKKVDDVVDQLVIPPIEIPSPEIQEIIPVEPTASKSNLKQNKKMGCLETLEKMEESSDDNILQGWENSQPGTVASSSRTNRLDGPSRSKRLSKNLQSAPKKPREENPFVDPFRKSIISPDKTSYKSDAFVSKLSNKVRFDGGRHPKQRTRTEKENYERRHSASTFRTRDSSPDAVIEIHSLTEKKSNRNQTEKSRNRNTNVLQLSSDSE